MTSTAQPTSLSPLYWLAPGTFALGSLTLSFISVDNLGWTAAACEVAALILTVSIGKHLVGVQEGAVTAA
jgi:hypothetical protein